MTTDDTMMPGALCDGVRKQQVRCGKHDGENDERPQLESDVVGESAAIGM